MYCLTNCSNKDVELDVEVEDVQEFLNSLKVEEDTAFVFMPKDEDEFLYENKEVWIKKANGETHSCINIYAGGGLFIDLDWQNEPTISKEPAISK